MAKNNPSRKVPMEMELQLLSTPVSKIQVVVHPHGSGNGKDLAQNNVDEISQLDTFEVNVGVLPAFLHDGERRYTKRDLKYNFFVLYFTAWIKASPCGVDKSSQNYPRLRVFYKEWWKNMICFGWFILALIRLFLLDFSTVHFVLTQDSGEELNRMTLMICLSSAFTLLMYSLAHVMFDTIQHALPLDNSVFEYLDQEHEKTSHHYKKEGNSQGKVGFKFGGHTPKELLIIHLPFLVFSLSGMVPLMSVFDPSFPLLLVSLLPPESRSRFSLGFSSVFLFDSIVCTYYIMIIHMVFYMFFCMHRIQEEAQLTLKNLTKGQKSSGAQENPKQNQNSASNSQLSGLYLNLDRETKGIWKAVKSLKLLHIWTQFYNLSFTTTVYSTKLIALSASILGGFGFIKMLDVENVPYAAVFALLFLQGFIDYNVCFGGAYEIPEKVGELKRQIRQLSHKIKIQEQNRNRNQNPNQDLKRDERKFLYVEKVLKSVPWLGVKDGVYKMERMTCVRFLEFVVRQITSLVLAY